MDYRLFLIILASLILVIWIWKSKHRSRSFLKTYASFAAIFFGLPFVASILLAILIDFSAYILGLNFQINSDTSSGSFARTTVTIMAMAITLPAVYKARRRIHTPVDSDQIPCEIR